MSKLLPNLPIENLTHENDYLGVIDKGNLIKNFLESNTDDFTRIKIFSLYGEWGSGKSTLMKYLQKELKNSFNVFFFESWEFESDLNLSLSLLEYLIRESTNTTEKALNELLKIGEQLFKGFAKSVKISLPGFSIDGSKLIENYKEDNKTFLQLKDEFKTEFIRWEDNITKDKNPNYNIVFIDDLDRCEPENVLNLLSAIKLFFTYGKKTIFLCGIDKKAVSEAVKTKYGEVVKANEYLEKIFDISFSMPQYDFTYRLVDYYLEGLTVRIANEDISLSDFINKFFNELHFTNPRRVKKILNKYIIIQRVIENQSSNKVIDLPNIITKNSGTLFETYLTLFLLILYEFEPENYKQLFNLSIKRNNYTQAAIKSSALDNPVQDIINNFNESLNQNLVDTKFKQIYEFNKSNMMMYDSFIACFAPNDVENLSSWAIHIKDGFIESFNVKRKSFEYYFTIFLIENENLFKEVNQNSDFSLSDYKKMIVNIM